MSKDSPKSENELRTVTSTELVKASGASFRQIDYWTRTGLLKPEGPGFAQGPGHHREYSLAQLARAKAAGALLRAGMTLPAVRKDIDEILRVGAVAYGPVTIAYIPKD